MQSQLHRRKNSIYALLYFIDQQCLASLVLVSWGPGVFALFSWSMVSKKWRVGEFSLTDVEDAARSLQYLGHY